MGELFNLLQGHVERWDGVRNKPLNNFKKQTGEKNVYDISSTLHDEIIRG